MKKQILFSLLFSFGITAVSAQGITKEMLNNYRKNCNTTGTDKVLNNAIAINGLKVLAQSANNSAYDTNFSNKVESKGITDQQKSGRCWLFSGLNVMRAKVIGKYSLGKFNFSQNYCFFYDQLEKSNLFLQAVIDNVKEPMENRTVEWLFKNPISDGGQFTGIMDIVSKYGVVPSDVMPETYCSNNTSDYAKVLSLKLREYGLTLRKMAQNGSKPQDLQQKKQEMLGTVYRILVRCFGLPPQNFTWTMRDAQNKALSTKEYTPKSFFDEYVGLDLKESYLMFMNDPTRPYYKTFQIDLDRHAYDGENWTFVNIPMEEIKQMAVASIKDSTMMYMSCDVAKELDSKKGFEDSGNFYYSDLLGVDFPMTKKERIETFASMSSHAMTLMAVDLDASEKPVKWMVENSWGEDYGFKGHIIMSDKWFDDYLFRLVVEKKYVPSKLQGIAKLKPILLPAWDPLFCPEE